MTNPHPTRPAACSRGPGLCRRSNTEARSHLMNALPPLAAGPRPRRPLQHATPTAQDDDGAGRSDGSTLDHTWPSLPRPVQAIDSCADPSAEVGKRQRAPARPRPDRTTVPAQTARPLRKLEPSIRTAVVQSDPGATAPVDLRPAAMPPSARARGIGRVEMHGPEPSATKPKHKPNFSDVQKGSVVNLEEPEIPGGWL